MLGRDKSLPGFSTGIEIKVSDIQLFDICTEWNFIDKINVFIIVLSENFKSF